MGTHACRKARTIFENALTVLAIELVSAAQGLDYHAPLKSSKAVEAAHRTIRREVSHLDVDRYYRPELDKVSELVRSSNLLNEVERGIGRLGW